MNDRIKVFLAIAAILGGGVFLWGYANNKWEGGLHGFLGLAGVLLLAGGIAYFIKKLRPQKR